MKIQDHIIRGSFFKIKVRDARLMLGENPGLYYLRIKESWVFLNPEKESPPFIIH